MISVKNLTFSYEDSPLFSNLSFEIAPQKITFLIGQNGSGKSTLAELLSGLLFAKKGEIAIDGLAVKKQTPAREIRQKIGLVLQNPDNQILFPKVKDDIEFALKNIGASDVKNKTLAVLEKVGIKNLANHEARTLSGGQKQKVAIASQLALNLSYLILDESTSMLDPESKSQIYSLLKSLAKSLGIIMISNNLSELFLADDVLILSNQTLHKYSVGQLLKTPQILEQYGLEIPFNLRLAQKLGIATKSDFSEDAMFQKISKLQLSRSKTLRPRRKSIISEGD